MPIPTNRCTLSNKMKVGMQQNKIRSLGEFASSSNVGLTAGDTMSQLITKLLQFLLARMEHHLQTGTL
jgi:hypothetical protein